MDRMRGPRGESDVTRCSAGGNGLAPHNKQVWMLGMVGLVLTRIISRDHMVITMVTRLLGRYAKDFIRSILRHFDSVLFTE